jgi:hypothetical protein
VLGQLAGDIADLGDVGVAVLPAEAEALAEVGADLVAVEQLHLLAAGGQLGQQRPGDGGLARAPRAP